MSTIQIRNKMDDEIHENKFYFMANAQLFDSSESTEILPMSNMAVNIAVFFSSHFHPNHRTCELNNCNSCS